MVKFNAGILSSPDNLKDYVNKSFQIQIQSVSLQLDISNMSIQRLSSVMFS